MSGPFLRWRPCRRMTKISLSLSFHFACHALRRFRNNGQQDVIRRLASEMHRGDPAKNPRGAILWVVVKERPAAGHLVFKFRQLAAAGAAIFIVLAADSKGDTVPGRRHDGGRPDLD